MNQQPACPDQRVLCATHPRPHGESATFPQGAGHSARKKAKSQMLTSGVCAGCVTTLIRGRSLAPAAFNFCVMASNPSFFLQVWHLALSFWLLHRDLTHAHVLKLLHNRGEDEGRNHVVVTNTLLRPWKRCEHTRDNHHGPHH